MKASWLVLGLGIIVACGDSSAAGGGGSGAGGGPLANCIDDPFACPTGQTCWISQDQTHFECLNSGLGQSGETCKNFAGQPSCTDGLTCLQLLGASDGTCTPYCDLEDVAHACPDDLLCRTVTLETSEFHACVPPETGGADAGGGDAGGADAGGAGGAG